MLDKRSKKIIKIALALLIAVSVFGCYEVYLVKAPVRSVTGVAFLGLLTVIILIVFLERYPAKTKYVGSKSIKFVLLPLAVYLAGLLIMDWRAGEELRIILADSLVILMVPAVYLIDRFEHWRYRKGLLFLVPLLCLILRDYLLGKIHL